MRTVPAVEGSADKVTVVLAAAEDKQQADLVDAGHVQMAAVEAETVSVAARGAEEAPVWIPGNWAGPVVPVYPGNFAVAAGLGWEDTAVGHTSAVGLMLGSMVAGPEATLGLEPKEDPGTGGACGAADKVVQLARGKRLMEGGLVLGKESGHSVVLEETVNKESAADPDVEPGWAGHNTVAALVNRSLRVPVVHKSPSRRANKVLKHN